MKLLQSFCFPLKKKPPKTKRWWWYRYVLPFETPEGIKITWRNLRFETGTPGRTKIYGVLVPVVQSIAEQVSRSHGGRCTGVVLHRRTWENLITYSHRRCFCRSAWTCFLRWWWFSSRWVSRYYVVALVVKWWPFKRQHKKKSKYIAWRQMHYSSPVDHAKSDPFSESSLRQKQQGRAGRFYFYDIFRCFRM